MLVILFTVVVYLLMLVMAFPVFCLFIGVDAVFLVVSLLNGVFVIVVVDGMFVKWW